MEDFIEHDEEPTSNIVALVVDNPERPEPTETLNEAQAAIWRRVVNALPADWFGAETWDCLEEYCKCVERAAFIEDALREFRAQYSAFDIATDDAKTKQFDKLCKLSEQQSRAISSLATRLRITIQSTRSAKASKDIEDDYDLSSDY